MRIAAQGNSEAGRTADKNQTDNESTMAVGEHDKMIHYFYRYALVTDLVDCFGFIAGDWCGWLVVFHGVSASCAAGISSGRISITGDQ